MKLNRIVFAFIFLFIFSSRLVAQNQSPQVSNVTFSQRTDGSFFVDINYDVNDPENDVMNVAMKVSDDNGATWDYSCTMISGDIGSNITSGTGKHIEWNFAAEHPETFGDQFRIKIIADDGGVIMGVPCPGIPTVTYEGKIYNTVQIGEQCWLKENLDVGTRIDGIAEQTDNGVIEKYCYDDNTANCETYGGLYQWNETMKYVTIQGTQGICPDGWHIPSYVEFQTLEVAVNGDGNALKREDQGVGDGQGTNTSGFSAVLAGRRYYIGGDIDGLGYVALFWSSREYDSTIAFTRSLWYASSNILWYNDNKGNGFSVRCVKD